MKHIKAISGSTTNNRSFDIDEQPSYSLTQSSTSLTSIHPTTSRSHDFELRKKDHQTGEKTFFVSTTIELICFFLVKNNRRKNIDFSTNVEPKRINKTTKISIKTFFSKRADRTFSARISNSSSNKIMELCRSSF